MAHLIFTFQWDSTDDKGTSLCSSFPMQALFLSLSLGFPHPQVLLQSSYLSFWIDSNIVKKSCTEIVFYPPGQISLNSTKDLSWINYWIWWIVIILSPLSSFPCLFEPSNWRIKSFHLGDCILFSSVFLFFT